MTQSTTYSSRDRAEDFQKKAADTAHNVANQVQDAANTVAQRSREAGENVSEVAHNFRSAFDKSLREQPIATLAMAAGVAFVLGALWKS